MAPVLVDSRLQDYLSEAIMRPWAWGEYDCLLFLADWVWIRKGVDPAGKFRGAYHDERSARRLMLIVGGIDHLVDVCVRPLGYRRVKQPTTGDIGLVPVALKEMSNRFRTSMIFVPMGSIYIGAGMWAVKPSDGQGLIARSFKPQVIWSDG